MSRQRLIHETKHKLALAEESYKRLRKQVSDLHAQLRTYEALIELGDTVLYVDLDDTDHPMEYQTPNFTEEGTVVNVESLAGTTLVTFQGSQGQRYQRQAHFLNRI